MTVPLWIFLGLSACSAGYFIYIAWLIQKNPGVAPWRDEGESMALLSGTIENWPSKDQLATILNKAGIKTRTGTHAIRLAECPSFVFRDLDGPAAPSMSADHDFVEPLRDITAKVSEALAKHDIRHRFEVYDADGTCVSEFGHS